MIGRVIAAGVLGMVLSQPATAEVAPAKRQAIKQLMETTGVLRITDQMATFMVNAQAKRMRQQHPDIPAEAVAVMREATNSVIREQIQAEGGLMDRLVPIYDRHFTKAELEELLGFYQTRLGRKVIRVMPRLMQESMTTGKQWGREVAPLVEQRIQTRLRRGGYLE